MKTKWISLVQGTLLLCLVQPAAAQDFKDKTHVSKTFAINQHNVSAALAVFNINGSIKVEGYDGDKVQIEVDQTISADEQEAFDQGKKEFKLAFEQVGDSVVAYISEPYDSRPGKRWNDGGYHHIEYHYNLEFTIKVPRHINLRVSTVNGGEVTVKDVAGAKLRAGNVNGGIRLMNVNGATEAHTVNGDVEVNYVSNPTGPSSYHTINGNIRVSYQPNLSADLQFKSMHGEFYTDFDNAVLPANITHNEENHGNGTVYKLNKLTSIRIGSGGSLFRFETLNGNVYIKKQS
jgi:hypothetical protein